MKNRHETYRGTAKKKLDLSDFLADGQEVEEALYDLYGSDEESEVRSGPLPKAEILDLDWHMPEINWDERAEIAEMSDFAERGLRIF